MSSDWPLVHVTAVEVVRDMVVRLTFEDGTVGELDLDPILRGPVFEPHRHDPEFFRRVYIDEVSGTIAWPPIETDLDPAVLYARVTGTYDDLMRENAVSD